MRTTASIDEAVYSLFEQLDAEAWDALVATLHPDAELADELTGEWLRGRDRVAGYLQAQRGIVSGISSRLRSLSSRWLGPELGLATFVLEQRYDLDGIEHRENLTGTTIFAFDDDSERLLLLFHLGAQSAPREATAESGGAVGEPVTLGQILRRRRRDAEADSEGAGGALWTVGELPQPARARHRRAEHLLAASGWPKRSASRSRRYWASARWQDGLLSG